MERFAVMTRGLCSENAMLQKYIFGFRNVEFETVPNQRGLLLQGNYYGLSVLSK
jgi:hypothetical protein